MYTETWTTPLANGVTSDKLIKILHHHGTLLDVLAPQKTRFEIRESSTTSTVGELQQSRNKSTSTTYTSSSSSSAMEKTSATTATSTFNLQAPNSDNEDDDNNNTTTYTITEPSTFGNHTFTISITGRADGSEALMSLPNGTRINTRWQANEADELVERVEIRAGCWARRIAKKRVQGHWPGQHVELMQLAATSKSMTGWYPLFDSSVGYGQEVMGSVAG